MADQSTTSESKDNVIVQYFKETRGELRKVTWPTPPEAWRWTRIVMLVMLVMTVILSTFDLIFSRSLTFLVDQFIGIGG